MSYMTLSSREKKEFLDNTFFKNSVHTFARIRQHYFSKYWGDGCMGRPLSQIWGAVPSGLRPCLASLFRLLAGLIVSAGLPIERLRVQIISNEQICVAICAPPIL